MGFKTVVTPNKTGVKRHYDQLAKIVDAHKCKSQSELIDVLNPVIRGWSNYYSRVCSKRTLTRLVIYSTRSYGPGPVVGILIKPTAGQLTGIAGLPSRFIRKGKAGGS